MKIKILVALSLTGSILLANPPAEEVLNVPQVPITNGANAQTAQNAQNQNMYQQQMQQPPMQQAPAQNVPQQNAMPYSQPMQGYGGYGRNYGGGYGGGVGFDRIIAKVQQMYPGAFITDVDYKGPFYKKGYSYKVEVNDKLELYFDMNGNLMWQEWD